MAIALTARGLEKRAIRLPVAPETAEYFIAAILCLVIPTIHLEALPKVIWMVFERRTSRHWWGGLCAHWNVAKNGNKKCVVLIAVGRRAAEFSISE